MPKLHKILLILIVSLFLFTRLYKISEIPLSLYWDEASIGYNAYSISLDGKDEWGEFLPIHFRAFGEFKLPVFIYSVVPFVKIFGLNEFSVRFPAVLYSLGIIVLTFLLARKLTNSNYIGFWSSFFIVISPWFFIFSRTGYEATAGLMFYLLAIYFFLNNTKNKWSLPFSVIGFILSAYSYNSFRIISPLTILLLVFLNLNILKDVLNKQKLGIVVSIVLLIIAIVPIYRLYAYDAGAVRLQAVKSPPNLIISNYLSHFSPDFLFISGDKNLRSQQSGFGQLYYLDLILVIMGVWYIFSKKTRNTILILGLFLLGPIPAALTKESPHALRSLSSVPFLTMLSAMGVMQIKSIFKVKYLEVLLVAIYLGFFSNYYLSFINIYPTESTTDWQYPYKKIYTNKIKFENYDSVIISDELAQPYIFALFYLGYNPQKFRSEVKRNVIDNWGFSTVSGFGNFNFGKIDDLSKKTEGKKLIFDVAR